MKTLLLAINAKYIHTNLAIRLLKANTKYQVDLIEYTIKDDISNIIDYIISNKYQILGISSYIWNIEIVKKLLIALKQANPSLIIILGGPEVSYDAIEYINNYQVDYVIVNEGEIAFNQLLDYLHHGGELNINNLVTKNYQGKLEEIKDLTKLASPHYLPNEYQSRITYIETSRGCPFNCAYCLASLEKHVRFFDINKVKADIIYLQNQGARTFKFLDRTFNTNPKSAIAIFAFIIANYKAGSSFQFEITGDILHRDIIDYLNNNAPKNLFRFEIGIQSTNLAANLAVDRIQDNQKLFNNIKAIQDKSIIDLHLDLIAGLPEEDIHSFENTFNEVISLRPLELQLGFLKLLKGTKLRKEAQKYGYVFQSHAPYEIIANKFLSEQDIIDVRTVEEVLEKYYNSRFMPRTITKILDNIASAFKFFLEFGKYYQKSFSWYNYNLHDLFIRINAYLKAINFPNYEEIFFILKYDYLSYFKLRPKIWWQRPIKNIRNQYIKELYDKQLTKYSLEDFYRYALIEKYQNQYLIAIYKQGEADVFIVNSN